MSPQRLQCVYICTGSPGIFVQLKYSRGCNLYSRSLNGVRRSEDLRFAEWSLKSDTMPSEWYRSPVRGTRTRRIALYRRVLKRKVNREQLPRKPLFSSRHLANTLLSMNYPRDGEQMSADRLSACPLRSTRWRINVRYLSGKPYFHGQDIKYDSWLLLIILLA